MKLVIVRHGETIENAQDVIMGQLGGTLSQRGIEQAKVTAERLRDEKFAQAWSSDLKRCVDTAKYILELHQGLNLQVTPALREVNYGEFQGRPSAEIQPLFEQSDDFLNFKVPGGESHQEMFRRTIEFVNSLYETSPGDSILIVTHTGPIEALRATEHRSADRIFASDAKNASIWHFSVDEALEMYPKS